VAFPDAYWSSYEHEVHTLAGYLRAVRTISAFEEASQARFIWRGVKSADWGLHSRLFRAYKDAYGGATPTERQLRSFEEDVLAEARDWSLDWHSSGGRLSALELLAALQHFGVPTRLIDFTFSPLVALWFAVESGESDEGRVFAIDISRREIEAAEASLGAPFWNKYSTRTDTPWTTRSWAWRPPPIEPRIARQESCFLMGGVPSTQPRRVYRGARDRWFDLHAGEVRTCMSLPFQLVRYARAEAAARGVRVAAKPDEVRAFTLRVRRKSRLRADLENALGYAHRTLFPDLTGFEQYGRSWRPPES
jgi:hypothetical protein